MMLRSVKHALKKQQNTEGSIEAQQFRSYVKIATGALSTRMACYLGTFNACWIACLRISLYQ